MNYESPNIGRYCIIRARDAGVHAGTVRGVDGRSVLLEKARRIWRWKGAFTLSELSLTGPAEGSRIAAEVATIEILDACEIILCSEEARIRIKETPNG